MGTLYDLELSLVKRESVATFEELVLGPLLKHPLVIQHFNPPPHLRYIPKVWRSQAAAAYAAAPAAACWQCWCQGREVC